MVEQKTKDKIRKKMKGRHPKSEIKKGHKWSEESIKKRAKKISKTLKSKGIRPPSRRGKRPWNYKGKAALQEKIRKSFEYRQWRSDVFMRDKFACQDCDKSALQVGGRIEAHHKKSFAKILTEYKIKTFKQALECEELWNINNGITLCIKCHKKRK